MPKGVPGNIKSSNASFIPLPVFTDFSSNSKFRKIDDYTIEFDVSPFPTFIAVNCGFVLPCGVADVNVTMKVCLIVGDLMLEAGKSYTLVSKTLPYHGTNSQWVYMQSNLLQINSSYGYFPLSDSTYNPYDATKFTFIDSTFEISFSIKIKKLFLTSNFFSLDSFFTISMTADNKIILLSSSNDRKELQFSGLINATLDIKVKYDSLNSSSGLAISVNDVNVSLQTASSPKKYTTYVYKLESITEFYDILSLKSTPIAPPLMSWPARLQVQGMSTNIYQNTVQYVALGVKLI